MDDSTKRLKFYGLNDMGTFMQVDRLKKILSNFDDRQTEYDLNEIIELNNLLMYINNLKQIKGFTVSEVKRMLSLKPKLYKIVSAYVDSLSNENIEDEAETLILNYRSDLVDLVVKNKIYERLDFQRIVSAFNKASIGVSFILSSKTLVETFDTAIKDLVLGDIKNAELVIKQLLEKESKQKIHLPTSLTAKDINKLISSYIDDVEANPNYLELISKSRLNKAAGIDAKLKLKAKQKHEAWVSEFFKNNQGGVEFGVGISIADKQEEPLVVSQENLTTTFSYSRKFLDKNNSPSAAIALFISLFQFVDSDSIMSVPAYRHELGVFERITLRGKDAYPTGVAFQFKEMTSFYQTLVFDQYLRGHGISIEKVIEWFYQEYLLIAYGVSGMFYSPATQASTYLEKSRHVFAEMDSVIKQFSLYAENGEIDQELFKLTSETYAYADIPSIIDKKYVYATDNEDIQAILHMLFSDQSSIIYIDENKNGTDLVDLLSNNNVAYDDFHDYQKPAIDNLIGLNVLEIKSSRVSFKNGKQVSALRKLFRVGTINYHQRSPEMRLQIDSMIKAGWLITKNTLLSSEEASLFNYYLNQRDFGNGLDLRNKYLHGSQGAGDDETEHYRTYIIAVELMILLVLKMNNEFSLKKSQPD